MIISCGLYLQLSEEVAREIAHGCHGLVRLDMSGVKHVDDDILITLAHNAPELKELCIKGCRQVGIVIRWTSKV